jgi:phage repressor protein C with HTH and peptisase S24 domain
MQKIIHRIFQYLDYKGIPHTRFEKEIGLSNGYLNTQLKRDADIGESVIVKIIDYCLDININWLISGTGEMLINMNEKGNLKGNPKGNPTTEKPTLLAAPAVNEGVPLIPVEAMAGFGSAESTQVFEYQIQERYVIPDFKGKVDFFIRVCGSSMYPKYNSGDIVACKRIESSSFIQWNKTYILDTTQGALVKRLIKSSTKGFITCRSDNKDYPDFELNIKEDINAIALIIGVIRFE